MERESYIDRVAGLLMVEVILMHCFHNAGMVNYPEYAITYPLTFCIPWFFYKSGMYYQHKEPVVLLKKGIHQFIVPLLVFSIIGLLVHTIRVIIQGDTSIWQYFLIQVGAFIKDVTFYGNQPLWFLFSFFVVKNITNWMIDNVNVLVLIFASFLTINILYYSHANLPYFFANIPAGILFYSLGYALRKIDDNKMIVAFSFVTYVIMVLVGWVVVDIHWNVSNKGPYYLWIPAALSGIILINAIFKCVDVKLEILEWLGRNSMVLFITHWIIIEAALLIFKDIIDIHSLNIIFYILILSEILCLPFVVKAFQNSRISWMVGR